MHKNIVLVYPPIDEDYYMVGVNDSPPLGLVVLQNYIEKKSPDPSRKILILDGEHNSVSQILTYIKDHPIDLVGIQPMMASYKNTLAILSNAKDKGCTTVLGGHHATQLARTILTNRRNIVDYIVCGDGEEAFRCIVHGTEKNQIPNIAYWDEQKGGIVQNKQCNVPIDLGVIDKFPQELLDQYIHSDAYERKTAKSFRSYSHKGCSNRLNSQYCYFCGRADKGLRFKNPKLYLDELAYLINECKAEYVFEIGDDFLQDENWLNDVIHYKEKEYPNLVVNLKIFARANRITTSIIKQIKRLNITEVAIGFESGSEKILQNISKNSTAMQNIEAARMLFSNKIDTIASYVLGLPGEDDASLEQTYRQAMEINELSMKYLGHPPQEIIGNLIEINPGSKAFTEIEKAFPYKYKNNDLLSIKGTQDDYFRINFNLDDPADIGNFRKKLASYSLKLNQLGRYTYPAGWSRDDFSQN